MSPITANGGLEELALRAGGEEAFNKLAQNPVPWLVPSALARTPRRQVAEKIKNSIKPIMGEVDPRVFTKVINEISRGIKTAPPSTKLSLKRLITNKSAIASMGRLIRINAAAKVRAFIRDSDKWRVNRWFALFALGYIIEESEGGRLNLGGEDRLLDLVADVFSQREFVQQGALFQLSQIAYFHIKHEFVDGQPAVAGIELERPGYTIVNSLESGKAYKRKIDIVLQTEDGEHWVETKSVAGSFRESWFRNRLEPKRKSDDRRYRGYFRQHFHDMRLNADYINAKNRNKILSDGAENAKFSWYFHAFKAKHGRPPTKRDVSNASDWLCRTPRVDRVDKYFEENLSSGKGIIKQKCKASNAVERRDTTNYVVDLLLAFASPDQLDIESYADTVLGME